MTGCGYEGCQWPGVHRPYARLRDGIPSVSTIAQLADDKGGMVWASAMIAATTAVHHHDRYQGLSQKGCTEEVGGLCQACRMLRSEHDRVWKRKAVLGSHVHHLIADLAAGVEVPSSPALDPYLDAWEAFVRDCQPVWEQLEKTVVYREEPISYRGTIDAIGMLTIKGERSRWLIDWKTGRYRPYTQTLQMVGYRHAQHITTWDDKKEVLLERMPFVDHCGVVCLSNDGTYRLHRLPAEGDAWWAFLALRRVWNFQKKMAHWEKVEGK